MLMVTGTIKSGKSAIVHEILPRLVAAEYLNATIAGSPPQLRPVIFKHAFSPTVPAEENASILMRVCSKFARSLGLPFVDSHTPTQALQDLPDELCALARGIHARGGVLWLLLDELQAPVIAPGQPPAHVRFFLQQLKSVVRLASPHARIAVTGSGMVSLLTAIRDMPTNGFMLWSAASHVSIGREPSPPVALAMATRIVAACSTAWPAAAKAFLTPERIVEHLARNKHGDLTSVRPALVAFFAECMGDGQRGTPVQVFEVAQEDVLDKLRTESMRDALLALDAMPPDDLRCLRALALEGNDPALPAVVSLASLFPGRPRMVKFASLLCEGGTPLRLQPPYGALFRSWITTSGQLSVGFRPKRGDILYLADHVRKNLIFLADNKGAISEGTRRAMSTRALAVLACNGVGIVKGGAICAPSTPEEVRDIPSIAGLLEALNQHALISRGSLVSPSAQELADAVSSQSRVARATFMAHLGLTVLRWVCHFCCHVWFEAGHIRRSGLSSLVVADVVAAVVDICLEESTLTLDASGTLQNYSAGVQQLQHKQRHDEQLQQAQQRKKQWHQKQLQPQPGRGKRRDANRDKDRSPPSTSL